MQHREPATRQERRSCGINWMNVGGHSRHWLGRPKKVQDCLAGFPPESVGLETSLSEIGDRATPGKAGEFPTARTIKKSSETAWRCCPTNANRSLIAASRAPSGGTELPPLGKSDGAGCFEVMAAGETALMVEVIVDRGVDGSELLKASHLSEAEHRPLSSSEGLV